MPRINLIPPPAAFIAELSYNPQSGTFFWKVPKNGRRLDVQAGKLDREGYRTISYERRTYRAHRLAWLIVQDEWPDRYLDHRNGDRTDNRISNLRLATAAQNSCNRRTPVTNTSGYRGVLIHRRSGRWNASIRIEGRSKFLGSFATALEAARAYDAAALSGHGEFAVLNFPEESRAGAAAGLAVEGRLGRGPYRKTA